MKIKVSCGNVFADLGLKHADELKRLADKCRLLPNGAEIFRTEARKLRDDD